MASAINLLEWPKYVRDMRTLPPGEYVIVAEVETIKAVMPVAIANHYSMVKRTNRQRVIFHRSATGGTRKPTADQQC